MTITSPAPIKMTSRQRKTILDHVCQNKKRLEFLLGKEGYAHEIHVLTERVNYWTAKLKS